MSAKPYTLSGDPTTEHIEQIDEMFNLLFQETGTPASHRLLSSTHSDTTATTPSAGAMIAATSSAWAAILPTISGTFPRYDGATTTFSAVSEGDITDGTILARLAANEIITGTWRFNAGPVVAAAQAWNTRNAADTVTFPLIRFAGGSVVVGDNATSNHNFINFGTGGATRFEMFTNGFYAATTNTHRPATSTASETAISVALADASWSSNDSLPFESMKNRHSSRFPAESYFPMTTFVTTAFGLIHAPARDEGKPLNAK